MVQAERRDLWPSKNDTEVNTGLNLEVNTGLNLEVNGGVLSANEWPTISISFGASLSSFLEEVLYKSLNE